MEKLLRKTISVCPECMEQIEARIVHDTEKSQILMKKTCSKHGDYEDIVSRDPDLYIWKNGFADTLNSRLDTKPKNIEFTPVKKGCPYDCGLCENHKSAANLMIVDITNRCNLNCPICFANANHAGRIVEYSYDEVVRIMEHFVKQRPYFAAIAQFSGGEPTLHPRIIDILHKAKELGFPHRMLNTNGIRMAKSLDFCRQFKETDCGAIYLSFDGLEPETYKNIRGVDLSKIKQKFIENCREVGIDGVMLVMTVAKGQNDHEVGAVLDYAIKNNDVVAGVVYQPVSLCGRVSLEDLRNLRYTNSDLIEGLKKHTNNNLTKFYPLGYTNKLSQLLAWFGSNPGWSISAHDDCGFATLAQVQPDGSIKPIEDYFNTDGLVKWANEVWDMVQERSIPKPTGLLDGVKSIVKQAGLGPVMDAIEEFSENMTDIAYKTAMKAYFAAGAVRYLKTPELKNITKDTFYPNIVKLLINPSLDTSKGMLMNGTIFVGSMHFQDVYNFDVERVSRCVVHYGVIDPENESKVLEIPFCAFNTIHRERIEKEWAKTHGKKLDKTPEQHAEEIKTLTKNIELKSQ